MLNGHRPAPLRVAVLCSHRAPGLLYLLNQCPDRGVTYDIVCCVTSEETFAEEVRVERRGIPIVGHPIDRFCGARGAVRRDMRVRAAYDAETAKRVAPFFPDLLLLDGYLYLITAPLLDAFRPGILNLHFADLTIRAAGGAPRFPGIRAVRETIAAGVRETRATVHVVDERPDAGPPLVRSWPFAVSALVEDLRSQCADDVRNAYVYAHQEWMIRTVSGPLIAAALRLVATGALDLAALSADGADAWLLDRDGLAAPEVELAAH
jgi:phosphoribosylglycinamide formyltransferase 1